MKRGFVVAAALALLAGAAPARAQTDGGTVEPDRFEAIEIAGSAAVRFTQGSTHQVVVEGGDDAQKALSYDIVDGRLRIHPGGSWRFWDSRKVRIAVTARNLSRVSISGAADFSAPGPLRAERLSVSISGAGSATFDALTAEALNFEVSGAGDGQASGSVKRLILRISGRSEFRGEDLRADRAAVSISGLGDVRVWAVQELDLSVTGVGKVDYWGTPSVKRAVSGAVTLNDRGARTSSR